MIISKEPYEYKGSLTKWTFQCDNPDCKKVFSREATKVRTTSSHYCCHPCSRGVVIGICKVEDCDQPIIKSCHHKIDSGLCTRHHKITTQALKRKEARQEMYEMMGNQCVNCGEKDSVFFQIDHIENDADYRGKNRAVQLQDYLQEPDRFQLLCANCNYAKRLNGGEIYRPAKFTRRKAQ